MSPQVKTRQGQGTLAPPHVAFEQIFMRQGPTRRYVQGSMRNMRSKLRVLVANEPRSYREAIARVFEATRPRVEVTTIEPEEIDSEVERLAPQMVVCSRVTPAVEATVLAWVELYPGHESFAQISVRGERQTLAEIELDGLLSIVDQAEVLTEAL